MIAMLIAFLLMLKQLLLSDSSIWAINKVRRESMQESQENQALQARNQVLLNKVVQLKSGDQNLESRAREELGLVKQNEIFYQIVNS